MPTTHIRQLQKYIYFTITNASIYWLRPQIHGLMVRESVCIAIDVNPFPACMRYRSKWNLYKWQELNPMNSQRANDKWKKEKKIANMKCSSAAGLFPVSFFFLFGVGKTLSISIHWEFILNSILVFGSHSVHFAVHSVHRRRWPTSFLWSEQFNDLLRFCIFMLAFLVVYFFACFIFVSRARRVSHSHRWTEQ